MATIADKLSTIRTSLQGIKTAIELKKGGAVNGNISTYSQEIMNLEGGGGTEMPAIVHITNKLLGYEMVNDEHMYGSDGDAPLVNVFGFVSGIQWDWAMTSDIMNMFPLSGEVFDSNGNLILSVDKESLTITKATVTPQIAGKEYYVVLIFEFEGPIYDFDVVCVRYM